MAKAKKNATRSGNKQRTHTKQHLTKEQLLEQRVKALSKRVEAAHVALDAEQARDNRPRKIIYKWGVTPAAPSFTIDEV